jgi:hypothetical protein
MSRFHNKTWRSEIKVVERIKLLLPPEVKVSETINRN